jgi:hypothetical protein
MLDAVHLQDFYERFFGRHLHRAFSGFKQNFLPRQLPRARRLCKSNFNIRYATFRKLEFPAWPTAT